MKKYIVHSLLFLLSLLSLSCWGLEYNSKLTCKGSSCETENEFKGLKEKEIKLTDLKEGVCLIDLKTEKISRVEVADQKTQKLFLLSEKSDSTSVTELQRELTWFNNKSFNRSQKIIPCTEVAGIIGDEDKLKKCFTDRARSVRKIFCEKERVTNF